MKAAILAALVAAGAALCAPATWAQAWAPSKPMRIVVPFPPGGTADVVARTVANGLAAELGQPAVVENRPGANGGIAAPIVAKAEPDGHVLLVATTGLVAVNPALYPKLGYDPVREFSAVATVCDSPMILIASPSFPANNVRELIPLVKSKPDAFNYASPGSGTFAHLAAEMLKSRAGLAITHVPYKGEGASIQDVIGGQVNMTFATLGAGMPMVKGGRAKALGIPLAERYPDLPEVPTFIEQGLPDFIASFWYGILAPAGTPANIRARLAEATQKFLAKPEVRELLSKQGVTPYYLNPDQFTAKIRSDTDKYAQIVKQAGMKVD